MLNKRVTSTLVGGVQKITFIVGYVFVTMFFWTTATAFDVSIPSLCELNYLIFFINYRI